MKVIEAYLGRLRRNPGVRAFARIAMAVTAAAAVVILILSLVLAAHRKDLRDAKTDVNAGVQAFKLIDAPDSIIAFSHGGDLRALDPTTGVEQTKTTMPSASARDAASYGSGIFVASGGSITRLNAHLAKPTKASIGIDGLSRLAAGPFGLFATERRTGALVRVDPVHLKVAEQVSSERLGGAPRALAVTRAAVWVIAANRHEALRMTRGHEGALRVDRHVPLPAGSTGLAVGAGFIGVLSPSQRAVLLIPARGGRPKPVAVELHTTQIAIGNGSLWALSADDSVSQHRLSDGARVGLPVTVAANPTAIIVNLHALWTTSSGTSTLTRLDLARLRSWRDGGPSRPAVLGVDRRDLEGTGALLGLLALAGIYYWRRSNHNRWMPRYELGPSPVLRLWAINRDYEPGLLGRRRTGTTVSSKRALTGTFRLFGGEAARELEQVYGEDTLERVVLRWLQAWMSNVSFVRTLGYLKPTVGPAPRLFGPDSTYLRDRFAAAAGKASLIDGHVWTVLSTPDGDFRLILNALRDPRRPDAGPTKVPDGCELSVLVRAADVTPEYASRFATATTLELDLVVLPRPANGSGALECELVFAFDVIRADSLGS